MISLDKLDTIKITVNKGMTLSEIDKYLYPVRQYVNEKFVNNMYDDWNELEHTIKWIDKSLKSINENNGDILNIYSLYDRQNIIGVVFVLSGSDNILKFIKENNIISNSKWSAQLSCFHILKYYRGIGKTWLKSVVLKDLKKSGLEEVYVKSSHNKAFSLYNEFGTLVGNYISISDHKLYQRYGYIYKIDL